MIRQVYPRTRCNRTFPACIAITFGRARQDKISKTRQDKTRQDKTRQDKTRQNKTRQDKTRQDKTRQDKTRQDKTRQDKTRQYLVTYTLTNYRACFFLFYSNIILANIRSNRMKPRCLIQVALVLFKSA